MAPSLSNERRIPSRDVASAPPAVLSRSYLSRTAAAGRLFPPHQRRVLAEAG